MKASVRVLAEIGTATVLLGFVGACDADDSPHPLVDAGDVGDLLTATDPVHFADDNFWVSSSDGELIALYDLDTHSGFREEDCVVIWRPELSLEGKSGWFRGECSGSMFDRGGVIASGPSPRSLDRLSTSIVDGRLLVDVGQLICGDNQPSCQKGGES